MKIRGELAKGRAQRFRSIYLFWGCGFHHPQSIAIWRRIFTDLFLSHGGVDVRQETGRNTKHFVAMLSLPSRDPRCLVVLATPPHDHEGPTKMQHGL